MWLVPRHSNGLHRRTPLPPVVREALIRWYVGEGSEADHRASVILVVKARTHHQWLACDCLGEAPPPLLSPAFLSEAETYYLRRLTSRLCSEVLVSLPHFLLSLFKLMSTGTVRSHRRSHPKYLCWRCRLWSLDLFQPAHRTASARTQHATAYHA